MGAKTFSIVIVSVLSSAALGQTPPQCTMETATSTVMEHVFEARVQSGTAITPILIEMDAINKKPQSPRFQLPISLSRVMPLDLRS